ncbi:MAG: hypothetical protein LH632_16750 [Rhodoferax sp.]|nr:hypothetical protein [Rhodoferax sp.]
MFVLADWLLLAPGVDLALGVFLALIFATRGAQMIDREAKGMPMSARVLILPGATGLWPPLLLKWLRQQSPPAA